MQMLRPRAALDTMEGLCWMLRKPKVPLKGHVAVLLALQARMFFEDVSTKQGRPHGTIGHPTGGDAQNLPSCRGGSVSDAGMFLDLWGSSAPLPGEAGIESFLGPGPTIIWQHCGPAGRRGVCRELSCCLN